MELDFDFMEKTFGLLWTGVPVTMEITIVSLLLASPIAFYFALNRIKGSSLAFLMTVKDVMAVGKIAASFGYNYIEAYLDAFLVYLILCTIIQLAYAGAERRFWSV